VQAAHWWFGCGDKCHSWHCNSLVLGCVLWSTVGLQNSLQLRNQNSQGQQTASTAFHFLLACRPALAKVAISSLMGMHAACYVFIMCCVIPLHSCLQA
jgi:hypothetical protein